LFLLVEPPEEVSGLVLVHKAPLVADAAVGPRDAVPLTVFLDPAGPWWSHGNLLVAGLLSCTTLGAGSDIPCGGKSALHSPPFTPKVSPRADRLAGQTVRAVAQLG
jgi:hypothetical protein